MFVTPPIEPGPPIGNWDPTRGRQPSLITAAVLQACIEFSWKVETFFKGSSLQEGKLEDFSLFSHCQNYSSDQEVFHSMYQRDSLTAYTVLPILQVRLKFTAVIYLPPPPLQIPIGRELRWGRRNTGQRSLSSEVRLHQSLVSATYQGCFSIPMPYSQPDLLAMFLWPAKTINLFYLLTLSQVSLL